MYRVYIYQHTVKPVIQTDTNETVRSYSLNVSVHFTMHPQLSELLIVIFSELKKLVIFHEFHCNMICISTTCMLLVFFTLTEFMLVLMLEAQKGCNGVVGTCI